MQTQLKARTYTKSHSDLKWLLGLETRDDLGLDDLDLNSSDIYDRLSPELISELTQLLAADESKKRIELAESLSDMDTTGLSQLVLARDSVNPEQREHHYLNAMDISKKRAMSKPTRLNVAWRTHLTALLEMAPLLWEKGERNEAVARLGQFDVSKDWIGSQPQLERFQSTFGTYLLCLGQDEKAREIMALDAVPLAQWYYLNALIQFRKHGDTADTRGALALALEEEEWIGYCIAANETTEDDDQNDEQVQEDIYYINVTSEAWHATNGAIDWLSRQLQQERKLVNEADEVEATREKRIANNLDASDWHRQRQDYKSAKRSLVNALKESEQIADGGQRLIQISRLLAYLEELMGSNQSYQSVRFIKFIEKLEKEHANASPQQWFDTYAQFAEAFLWHGSLQEAQDYAVKALSAWSRCVENEEPFALNSFDYVAVLDTLVTASMGNGAYELASMRSMEKFEILERLVGPRHVELVAPLESNRFCLHKLERHEEERAILDRVIAMDPNGHKDAEFECIHDERTQMELCESDDDDDYVRRSWDGSPYTIVPRWPSLT